MLLTSGMILFFFCNTAAATVTRVVERTVPVTLGTVVHSLGLIATAKLWKGPRKASGRRHEGQQRDENHTRDIGTFSATIAWRQRVRLYESGYSIYTRWVVNDCGNTGVRYKTFIIPKIFLLFLFYFIVYYFLLYFVFTSMNIV